MSVVINKRITKIPFVFRLIREVFFQLQRKVIGRRKYFRKRYNKEKILNNSEGNDLIKECLLNGSPFMVARFGDGELRTVVYYLMRQLGLKKHYPDYIRLAICRNAGFFPDVEEELDRFGELMLNSIASVDILAVWFNLMEEYIYSEFGPVVKKCILLEELEPFMHQFPWSLALSGKKVLVIHPFAETIQKQYKKRHLLFSNQDVLPDFHLITLKAVQSIGGTSDQFSSWFEALDYMFCEAIKIDFDVAIIGCGAYGLPLAAKIKNEGKIAIHMGGVTQMLFGIKGHRWDDRTEYSSFYNENWCRPNDSEKPKIADNVENACYW